MNKFAGITIAVGLLVALVAGWSSIQQVIFGTSPKLQLASSGASRSANADGPPVQITGAVTSRAPDAPAGAPSKPSGEPAAASAPAGTSASPAKAPPVSPVKARPADAGAQGDQKPTTASQDRKSAETPPTVDESALRYFARKGDEKRLKTEIARLKALYPNWTPPANPLDVPPARDKRLDAMWKLYADGKYAELHQAIAARQASDPNWQPPQDLIKLLAVAENRERLINASNLKQYDTVIRLASETPSLLTCSEIDMLWRVGEAFAKTGRQQRAEDDYRYILNNCTDKANRLATMQKALALLPRDMVDNLLALEKGGKDAEFASIRDELARRSAARGGTDPTYTAPAGDLDRLKTLAQSGGKASDALLLGWYDYRHNQFDDAEQWFRKAREEKDSASASQGLALILVHDKKPAEAEAVIYPWRKSSPDARAVYLAAVANLLAIQPPPDIKEDVLARMATEVVAAKDAAAAQQFGWYARSLNQHRTAEAWFKLALDWKPNDEPSSFGLALTYYVLHDVAALSALQKKWAGHSQRIADIGKTVAGGGRRLQQTKTAAPSQPSEPGAAPAEPSTVRPAQTATVGRRQRPSGCSGRVDPSGLSSQAALDQGWCLMNLQRPVEAVANFGAALRSSSARIRADAAYGQSLAYLRLGLTAKAAIAATQEPQPAQRRIELQSAILADRAVTLFDKGRYAATLIALDQRARIAAEQDDLMLLRGFAYQKLHRYLDAKQIFEALAATGDRDAVKALADLRSEMSPSNN